MKKTTQEMNDALANAKVAVPTYTQWLHYRGGIYTVLGHMISTDTGEVLVRYSRLDGPHFDPECEREIEFARPLSEWLDRIPTPYGCDADGNMIIPPGSMGRFEQVKKVEMWKLRSSKDKSIVIR